MRLSNPLTFAYNHENFGADTIKTSLNLDDTSGATLKLEVVAPDGRAGTAALRMGDNGNVTIELFLDGANPIHVKVNQGGSVVFEG